MDKPVQPFICLRKKQYEHDEHRNANCNAYQHLPKHSLVTCFGFAYQTERH